MNRIFFLICFLFLEISVFIHAEQPNDPSKQVYLEAGKMEFENKEVLFTSSKYIQDEKGLTSITTSKDESYIFVGDKKFENMNKGSIVKVDSEGNLVGADITSNKDGAVYFFDDKSYTLPKGTRLIYQDKTIQIIKPSGEKFSEIEFDTPSLASSEEITTNKIKFYGGSVTIKDEGGAYVVSGSSFSITDEEGETFSVKKSPYSKSFDKSTFAVIENGRVVKIPGDTSLFLEKKGIAQITEPQHDLYIYYGKDFFQSEHLRENYVNYGIDELGRNKIDMNGDGFLLQKKDGTGREKEIFSGYNFFLDRDGKIDSGEGNLEFKMNGGTLSITEESSYQKPLALKIESKGDFKINNGEWVFDSRGGNLLAQKFPAETKDLVSSDIQFFYNDRQNKFKNYDFDVDSSYSVLMDEKQRESFSKKLEEEKEIYNEREKQINQMLESSPDLKSKKEILNKYLKEKEKIEGDLTYLSGQLTRAKKAGTPEQVKSLTKKIEDKAEEGWIVIQKINALWEDDPSFGRVYSLIDGNRLTANEIKSISSKLEKGVSGKEAVGFFGESISTGSNSQMAYSQYIQGFPVIRNTEYKTYYSEIYDPFLGKTVGGVKLEKPIVHSSSQDILNLPVDSRLQTCADTQIELFSLFQFEQMKNGERERVILPFGSDSKKVSYNSDGTYVLCDGSTGVYSGSVGDDFDFWMADVQNCANTGTLSRELQTISIYEAGIGDIILFDPDAKTGYGHALAIKQIIEIPPQSGNLYYQVFGGTDPASDALIRQTLYSQEELAYKITSEGASIKRWNL